MCRLGIDAICECGFDYKMNSVSEPHAAGVMSFRRLLVSFRTRLVDMIPFFNKLPFKDNIQRREDLKFFKKSINNMIAEKKAIINNTQKEKTNKKNEDILSILLKARDENDKGLSDDSLSAQIGGFLFAGFETTSTALTWILLNLAEHEDVQDKVRAEIQQVLPSSDQPLTRTDFDKLTYMVCVINETLRLFPPATVYFRQSVKDDTLNGYFIPAKTIIGVSVSGLHRHPDNWENPDSFIPERFQEEYDHYKFMPFAHGPLMCIGKRFAMTEIQTVLTLLLRSFKFHKAPSYKYRRIQNLTMVPNPPLVLRIEKI
ncbi:cytochrome P450 3A19 [Patella vulgata]|uniref:cytochrome P450 3A19 n=1 Tax=Patella vulgata TaxID=6465 RepID=UPI00218066BE|nr:cytochrome P450 3A19 [Patella vulgata]